MSLVNTEIKPFIADAYHQGSFVPVTDADLRGKWSVVFFYPADFTFVCPTELGDLADHYAEFRARGVEIYSVSTDTHFTHKAWHDASETIAKIQYPMIGDPTHTLSRNFEILREAEGLADQKRVISALIDGVRVVNLYVPNGASLKSPKYAYKLEWLACLERALEALRCQGDPLVVVGDFNNHHLLQ